MQYSLVHRFEGCLAGLALTPAAPGCTLAMQLLHQIPRSHPATFSTLMISELNRLLASDLVGTQMNVGTLAIATLPLTLYYHDDLHRQRQAFQQLFDAIAVKSLWQDWLMVYAYAIAQAVKGQLDPQTFVAQALAYLRITETDDTLPEPNIVEQLQWIKTCQSQAASLTMMQTTLETYPMALDDTMLAIALVCFLQTPDQARLALARSVQLGGSHREEGSAASNYPSTIKALVGALIGAHNGVAGFPPAWMIQATLPSGSGSMPQMQSLAKQLYAIWCGVYEPTAIATETLAVAAPWVIRLK